MQNSSEMRKKSLWDQKTLKKVMAPLPSQRLAIHINSIVEERRIQLLFFREKYISSGRFVYKRDVIGHFRTLDLNPQLGHSYLMEQSILLNSN
jgi:hypothetical protein